MKTIKVKNVSGASATWANKEYTNNEIYTLQTENEAMLYRKDDTFLKAICDDDAEVHDENGVVSSSNSDELQYIFDLGIQRWQQVMASDSLSDRPYGFQFTATKNTTTTHNHKVEESGLMLAGGFMETKSHEFGDEVDVKIVDVDNVLGYGAGVVLNDYVKRFQVRQSGENQLRSLSISDPIPVNTYVQVKYYSVGTTNDVKVGITLEGYKQS